MKLAESSQKHKLSVNILNDSKSPSTRQIKIKTILHGNQR